MFGFGKKDDSLNKFYELTGQLSYANDVSQLIYLAVDYALNHLGFDRMGILLYNQEKQHLQGTWGTDRHGVLRNEEDISFALEGIHEKQMNPECKGQVVFKDNTELYEGNETVGKGWHATIVIFDKDKCQGWIVADNLLNHGAFTHKLKNNMKLFGAIVSQLIVRIRAQKEFAHINDDLTRKNNFLEKTMEKLSIAQDQIVESEKLSALGRLVQGIANELSEPLMESIQASKYFRDNAEEYFSKQLQNQLLDSDHVQFHQQVSTLYNKINQNQLKAYRLLEQFQTIASNQTDDSTREVNVDVVIPELIENIKQVNKATHHEFIVISETKLQTQLQIGLLTQVFNQLVQNSLKHGFSDLDAGIIKIFITRDDKKGRLVIEYSDNGKGVGDNVDKLYDPFKNKEYKKTGLGLGTFIVYNLIVQRMGGYIEAVSPESGGLKYTMNLPLNAAEKDSNRAAFED